MIEELLTFLCYFHIRVSVKSAIHGVSWKVLKIGVFLICIFSYSHQKNPRVWARFIKWSVPSFLLYVDFWTNPLYRKLAISTEPKIKFTCNMNRRFNLRAETLWCKKGAEQWCRDENFYHWYFHFLTSLEYCGPKNHKSLY